MSNVLCVFFQYILLESWPLFFWVKTCGNHDVTGAVHWTYHYIRIKDDEVIEAQNRQVFDKQVFA